MSSALSASAPPWSPDDLRYAAFFDELDAWTEYWDVLRPASRGRFYFGDGGDEPGLLTQLLPRLGAPPPYKAWTAWARGDADEVRFRAAIAQPAVASAVREVDALNGRIFASHFGDPRDPAVRRDYLTAIHRFATDVLPPCPERAALVGEDDPRWSTAGRHKLEGDVMWFAWSLLLDAALGLGADEPEQARRALQLAAVAVGCPADFAWRGHRRTRAEYVAGPETAARLMRRGLAWCDAPAAAAAELRALYRIREWGDGDEPPLVDESAASDRADR
jgi:hypothetical protein